MIMMEDISPPGYTPPKQGSPVPSKADKTPPFHGFSTWKKPFLPVSSTEIRKKLKIRRKSKVFSLLEIHLNISLVHSGIILLI